MRYETPERRYSPVQEALETIRGAGRVILTTHMNADGDAVGSEVAVCAWLRASGADAWLVNPTPFPSLFEFLLPDPTWVVPLTEDRVHELCGSADLALVLDTGEVPRLGRVKPLIGHLDTVVVDHHPTGDQPIAGVSFRDPSACATGEMVYDLIRAARGPWPRAVLEGIYVAILTDTGSFRFSNATPACHRVAADLIEMGVDPEEMHRRVYGAAPLRRFRLLRICLDTLQVDPDGMVAWMEVPRDAVERLQAEPEDLEGLVDYPRAIEGVEVGVLFRQTARGDTKVSFRSNGPVDVNQIARDFGGGGHVRASGALVTDPPHKVVPKVVAATLEAARKLQDASGSYETLDGTTASGGK